MSIATGLKSMKCVPCGKGTPPLGMKEARELLRQVPGWEMVEGKAIRRQFKFKTFRETQAWLNRVADLAEEEGHHPDITWSYSKVTIELSTHSIGGLSGNDFIMAARIDGL
jgi:4a-hydroxytetrahydrobiopterin dehydratase